jgi:lysozyme
MARGLTRKQKGGAAIAALLAVATPLVAQWEGVSTKPYADKLAGGLMTVCFGETRVPMREYTRQECDEMLSDGVAEFALGVAKRNPELIGHPNQWAAATSLAYNAGLASYAGSTMARRFSEGRWRSACEQLPRWNRAGGKAVKGLTRRRNSEMAICLRDIPARFDR